MKAILRPLVVVATLGAVFATGLDAAQVSPQSFAAELSNAYAEIAGRLEPSVVSIDVTERVRSVRRFRDGEGEREVEGVGSGFIVDPGGYVLTNNHVVDGATRIVVRLSDDTELDATLVGADPETDLALLEVGGNLPLTAVTLGDSDAIRPGHLVLALGSPFGFRNSVSAGIVSAQGRDIPGGEAFQRFIQTDAAIHPGNSGGPLVNMAGEVIGVNTAVVTSGRSSSGMGFALPSNTARDVIAGLLANGRVVRGSIGVTFSTDAAASREAGGVPVTGVLTRGPAGRAGVRAGDVILEIEGVAAGDGDALLALVAALEVGTTVPIRVSRNGTELALEVEIVDREQLYADGARTAPGRFR